MAKATIILALALLCGSMMANATPSVTADPIVTGFDGQVFDFHATGDYSLLATEEWKVDATFLDPYDGKVAEKKSFTSSVRVTSPTGESITCALGSLAANASLQMTSASPDASFAAFMKPSPQKQSAKLGQVEGSIVAMSLPGLAQCTIHTPKFTLTVNHVSGAEQAKRFPNVEGWAATFTWLDTSFELKGPLNPPVTGILGATYPVKTPEDLLRATATAEGVANVAGRRALRSGPNRGLLMTAGVKVEFGEVHFYGPSRRLASKREA